MATDKDAREEALDALWQSEERFRLLVDAVKDYAIFMVDLEGRIASWNTGAARMTGFTAEDVLGKPLGVPAATGRQNGGPGAAPGASPA